MKSRHVKPVKKSRRIKPVKKSNYMKSRRIKPVKKSRRIKPVKKSRRIKPVKKSRHKTAASFTDKDNIIVLEGYNKEKLSFRLPLDINPTFAQILQNICIRSKIILKLISNGGKTVQFVEDFLDNANDGDINFPQPVFEIINAFIIDKPNQKQTKILNSEWPSSCSSILDSFMYKIDMENLLRRVGYDQENLVNFFGERPIIPLEIKYVINYVLYFRDIMFDLKRLADNAAIECANKQIECDSSYFDLRYSKLMEYINSVIYRLYDVVALITNINNFYDKINSYVRYDTQLTKLIVPWIIPMQPPNINRQERFRENLTKKGFYDTKIPYGIKQWGSNLRSILISNLEFEKIDSVLLENLKNQAESLLTSVKENCTEQLMCGIVSELDIMGNQSIHPGAGKQSSLKVKTIINCSGIPIFALDSMHDLKRLTGIEINGINVKDTCIKNLKKLLENIGIENISISHTEQLCGQYVLTLKRELDKQEQKNSSLALVTTNKRQKFELMTFDEYFDRDVPSNVTSVPASISNLVGNARTITAQDVNGKIGGLESNIQNPLNNTLCSIDAGIGIDNFDRDESGWTKLNELFRSNLEFSIEMQTTENFKIIIDGTIDKPGGNMIIYFKLGTVLELGSGGGASPRTFAIITLDNSKHSGIDNKTGAYIATIIDSLANIGHVQTNPKKSRGKTKAIQPVLGKNAYDVIKKFKSFFEVSLKITQLGADNIIKVSNICELEISRNFFRNPNLSVARDSLIAVAPLLLKFYGDQTFRITAGYAGKLNQIYQTEFIDKTSSRLNLNKVFSDTPNNALSVNIASVDYIHFISTLSHDVIFTKNNKECLEILKPGLNPNTDLFFNEIPLFLGEDIPGTQIRDDSTAKPNITVISAQDDVQKIILSSFLKECVSDFMSALAECIIRKIGDNAVIQNHYSHYYQQIEETMERFKGVDNIDESQIFQEITDESNQQFFEITINNLEDLYNIYTNLEDETFASQMSGTGTDYLKIKSIWEGSGFYSLKFKIKLLFTGNGFKQKIIDEDVLTELIVDDRYTYEFFKQIFNSGITKESIKLLNSNFSYIGTYNTTYYKQDGLGAEQPASIDDIMDQDISENSRSGPFDLNGMILANHLAYIITKDFRSFSIPVISSDKPSEYDEGWYYMDENGAESGPYTIEEICKEGEFDEKGVGSTKKRRFLQPGGK